MSSNKEKKVIDLSKVVGTPILDKTKNNSHIWTGFISSKSINSYMFADEESREKFTRLLIKYENIIKEYRLYNNLTLRAGNNDRDTDKEKYILELASELKSFLVNASEHKIDMDLFWVALCSEYEEILEKNPEEFKNMGTEERKSLEAFKKNFEEKDFCIREIYVDTQNKYYCYPFLTKSQEKRNLKHTQNNIPNLVQLLENISGKKDLSKEEGLEVLKEIVAGVNAVDLLSVFQNTQYAEMQFVTFFKNYLLQRGIDHEKLDSMTTEEIKDTAFETYNSNNLDLHSSLIAETIINSIQYIDLEKLLLISIVRPLEAYRLVKPEVETKDDNKVEILEMLADKSKEEPFDQDEFIVQEGTTEWLVEKMKRTEFICKQILDSKIISKRTKFNLIMNDRYQEISLKKVNELMENYCDGMFLSDVLEMNLKYNAYYSEDEMNSWSDELIRRMNFTIEDKCALSVVNLENLKRFSDLGILDEQDIKAILQEISYEFRSEEEIEKEELPKQSFLRNIRKMLGYMVDENIIEEQQIKEYLDEDIITVDMIEDLEDDKTEEQIEELHIKFGKIFNKETLLSYYKSYAEKYLEFTQTQLETPEETEKIEELRKELNNLRDRKEVNRRLFNRYNSKTSEQEKHNLGDQLLETYYVEMDVTDEKLLQESLKNLYEDEMIDLENIIHLDKDYIIPMLDKLSLEDTTKVRNTMSFEQLKEMLDDIFSDKEISDERKFIIVMNLLGEDTEEDRIAREFYLGMLEFDNNSERKSSPKGKRNLTGNGTNYSNKYVYPDFVKWKFYKGLDKDVRVTRYANGFVEFASSKLGARIIEKYYDGDKPAYGTATYILPEQEYRKNQGNLITLTSKGSILESATLREITPRKDRIVHRTKSTDKTWMDEVVKYFDIDYERESDTRYTKEELEDLQKIVEKYKTQYEIIS